MKKVFSLLIISVIFAVLSVSAVCVQAATCDTYKGSNVSAQNYSRWSAPVYSYLSVCKNGKLMRFQASESIDGYLVEYYSYAYDFESKKIISKELPVFGAFYETDNNYFILSGQNNLNEYADTEVFRITKYDKSWNRIGSTSLSNCNTTVPFDAGSARMTQVGNTLMIRTSHKMYKSNDGYNHQANVTIAVDINSMTVTDARTYVWNTENGYVSHSFNQFVKSSDDLLAFLDHGDAYPRSVVLFTQKGNGALNCYDLLTIPGAIGDNTTGVTVGGFEISSSSYIVAMSNVTLDSNYKTNKVKNIYIATADRKSDGTINIDNVKVNKITYYNSESESASTPQLVKLSDNSFVLLWESAGNVYYCKLDSKGNKVGDVFKLKGNLSDCVPVVYNNNLVWYTWADRYTEFYEIDITDPSKYNTKLAENGHKYVCKSLNANKASLECTVCGDKTVMTVATSFETFWKTGESQSGYYSTVFPTGLSEGDTLNFNINISENVDNDEIEISVSDPSIVSAPLSGKSGTIKIIGHGETTVTFSLRYNPDVKKTFTVNTHKEKKLSKVDATCTTSGLTEGIVCSVCDMVIKTQEAVPALGHNFIKTYVVDKQPTCTENGTKSYHCSRCSEVKDVQAIAATGHNFGSWVVVTGPTCTAKGLQTRTCKVCSEVETQNSNALGHSFSSQWTVDVPASCIEYGSKSHHCIRCEMKKDITRIELTDHDFTNWTTYTAPTCTNDGIETRKCLVCSEVETRAIMKLGHKEKKDNALEPTCVLSGKTQGSHCITCGYVFEKQEEIPALGHDVEIDIYVDPTCTAQGKTEGSHCKRCKTVIVKQELIPERGHTLVVDESVAPTCDKSGKTEGSHCEICGVILQKPMTIAAKGHNLIDTVTPKTCTTDGFTTHQCTVCGYSYRDNFQYALGHKEVTEKQLQETCTTDGLSVKTYCSECGLIFSEGQIIPATGHKPETTIVPATTKKNGSKSVKCANCGIKMSSDVISKIASVKLSQTSYIYDAKAKKPSVIVKTADGKTLKNGTDFKVTYDSGRKKAGTYYVTVTFKGDYSGKKSLKFKIVIDKTNNLKVTAKSKSAALKWDKVKGAAKYEVYCSTSKNGKYQKIATTKSNSVTAKKLTSGKTYYFKVRAVASSSSGGNAYGAYSSIKKVKVK